MNSSCHLLVFFFFFYLSQKSSFFKILIELRSRLNNISGRVVVALKRSPVVCNQRCILPYKCLYCDVNYITSIFINNVSGNFVVSLKYSLFQLLPLVFWSSKIFMSKKYPLLPIIYKFNLIFTI